MSSKKNFNKYKKQHRKSQKSDYINKGYEEEEDINVDKLVIAQYEKNWRS